MAWTIANCIVTRKFVVVTYSGVPAPDFNLSGVTNGFRLSLAGAAAEDLSSASITFYPAIPSTIITHLPADPNRKPGTAFSLTVTDESGYQAAPYDGVVSDGEPEAVALLFNQMMESLNPTGPINQVGAAVAAATNSVTGAISGPGNNSVVGAINNAAGVVAGAFNAPTFPILTEDISYSQPSLGTSRGSSGMSGGGGSIGQVATQAIAAVLGWKLNNDDPKAFVGALTQSFTLTEVEGHVQSTWVPRSYAVQTDLSGGITGAQASIYTRAKEALDQSLPLLNGLYALDPMADPEDVTAYRDVVITHLTQLVDEFGFLGGPRVPRVNTYFLLLLGQAFPLTAAQLQTDSDRIGGSLGKLRDLYGIYTLSYPPRFPLGRPNPFINSIDDEQDTTNFRVLSDYITSLALSWINNLPFFGLNTQRPFFGTQLVLVSRQLSVISEDVDEVRFAMDSVFIGPSERQTLQVNFGNGVELFFEDFAKWVQSFVADEAPPLIQDGGIYAVRFTFLPVAQQLAGMALGCLNSNPPPPIGNLPPGFYTGRVQQALVQLSDDLNELVQLATNI